MNKLSELEAYNKVIEECNKRNLIFLGWVDNLFLGSQTKLLLKDKTGKTTNTTSYNNLFKLSTNWINPRKLSEDEARIRLVNSGCPYDLGKFKYSDYHGKSIYICHKIDNITGKEHGEFEGDI